MDTIYFGHSRMTYDTQMEMDAIWIIINAFPNCKMVNSNIPLHQDSCWDAIKDEPAPGKEIGYFLDLTEECNIGCFLQYYAGKWSAGSAAEVNYMLEAGKKTFQVNLPKKTLEPVIERVEAFTFQETLGKLSEAGITKYI